MAGGEPGEDDGGSACRLCNAPTGRAALMLGGNADCPVGCRELCCTGVRAVYLVEDMDEHSAGGIAGALSVLRGVELEASCHSSGRIVLKHDPARIEPPRIIRVIRSGGATFIGEEAWKTVAGMTTRARAGKIEKRMASIAGVRTVEAAPGANAGTVMVVFDPAVVSKEVILAAIDSHGFPTTGSAR